ncbi:MAG: hypothetical protein ABDH23_04285 [Endomicrobiia bacterium]
MSQLKRNKKSKSLKNSFHIFISKLFCKYITLFILVLLVLTYFPSSLWHFPDGIGYYSYLPAVFKYKNYDFYKIIKTYTPNIIGTTKSGFVINDFDIGCSIVWLPVYFLASLFENEKISILFTNFFSSLLGLGSLWIFLKFAKEKLKINKRISFFICICVFLGTPLLFYSYAIPQNAHTTAAFLCSLFFIFWFNTINEFTFRRFLTLGILLGIISCVRLQRIILIIPIILEFILKIANRNLEVQKIKKYFLCLIVLITGFFVGFSPSLVNSKIIFSQLMIPKLYTISLNRFIISHIFEVLFSSYHSVILWTPLILLSILGLIRGLKYNFLISLSLILVFLIETFIISLVISPGGGASFGIRYYTDLIFIFAMGLYFLFISKKYKFYFIVLSILCSLWTFILFILSLTNQIDLLEVYSLKNFFINISTGFKNLNVTLKPRYIAEFEIYLFLLFILLVTKFSASIFYNTILRLQNINLLCVSLVIYLIFFNYSLIKAGLFNRITYKKEIFEESLILEDYQKFYILAGINIRLKYYKTTNQTEKLNFYLSLKEKIKPKSYTGRKVILPLFYNYVDFS